MKTPRFLGGLSVPGGAVSTAVGQAVPGGTAGIDAYLVLVALVGLLLTGVGLYAVQRRERA